MENFINGNAWRALRVIASLEQVVNSPLWGYEYLSIRQPLDGLDAGQTWLEGRLRTNSPDEAGQNAPRLSWGGRVWSRSRNILNRGAFYRGSPLPS